MLHLRLHRSQFVRRLFVAAGLASLIAGVLGIFLPVLPTTPFVLLAAACFARGSERFHAWLLAHRLTGPLIREWYLHRSIPRHIKRWAYLLMGLSFGSSMLIVQSGWLRIILAVLGLMLAVLLWRIPSREPGTRSGAL